MKPTAIRAVLPPEQAVWLYAEAAQLGTTVSAIVREPVADLQDARTGRPVARGQITRGGRRSGSGRKPREIEGGDQMEATAL